MSIRLDKPLRREVEIDGEPFTLTIEPDGLRLTRKRFRSGVEMSWKALWESFAPGRDRADGAPAPGPGSRGSGARG